MYHLNIPKAEIGDFTDQIERRDFTMLFENFEAYDVQATRRESRAEGQQEAKANAVLLLLSCQGQVPDTAKKRILAEQDFDLLDSWLIGASKASSVEAFLEDFLPELDS